MGMPFEGFLTRIDKIESLCKKYKEHFKFKPRYHIEKFGREITVKFRIFTHDPDLLFEYQPEFANDLYEIINREF